MTRHVVLVHGAWHGSWAWDALTPLLAERGLTVHTVDLPSSGPDPALGDLAADSETVRAAVDAIREPVTLVGHSYGGMAITQAAAGLDNVDRLVYLAAFMLPSGLSLLQAVGGVAPPWWQVDADRGTVAVPDPVTVFFNDCSPAAAAAATARLGLQSLASFEQTLTAAAWEKIPSSYIVCERDAAIPPPAQEAMSAAAAEVLRMPTGHSPFISDPEGLARNLIQIVERDD